MTNACVHHYVLASPTDVPGARTEARCRECGATREFSNVFDRSILSDSSHTVPYLPRSVAAEMQGIQMVAERLVFKGHDVPRVTGYIR